MCGFDSRSRQWFLWKERIKESWSVLFKILYPIQYQGIGTNLLSIFALNVGDELSRRLFSSAIGPTLKQPHNSLNPKWASFDYDAVWVVPCGLFRVSYAWTNPFCRIVQIGVIFSRRSRPWSAPSWSRRSRRLNSDNRRDVKRKSRPSPSDVGPETWHSRLLQLPFFHNTFTYYFLKSTSFENQSLKTSIFFPFWIIAIISK